MVAHHQERMAVERERVQEGAQEAVKIQECLVGRGEVARVAGVVGAEVIHQREVRRAGDGREDRRGLAGRARGDLGAAGAGQRAGEVVGERGAGGDLGPGVQPPARRGEGERRGRGAQLAADGCGDRELALRAQGAPQGPSRRGRSRDSRWRRRSCGPRRAAGGSDRALLEERTQGGDWGSRAGWRPSSAGAFSPVSKVVCPVADCGRPGTPRQTSSGVITPPAGRAAPVPSSKCESRVSRRASGFRAGSRGPRPTPSTKTSAAGI